MLAKISTHCVEAFSPVKIFEAAGIALAPARAQALQEEYERSTGIVRHAEHLRELGEALRGSLLKLEAAWTNGSDSELLERWTAFRALAAKAHEALGRLLKEAEA